MIRAALLSAFALSAAVLTGAIVNAAAHISAMEGQAHDHP